MANKTKPDENRRIGAMLRDAREAGKVTQGEMSEAVDITRNHISAIERGENKAPISMLIGYADKLGITPNDILGYHGTEISPILIRALKDMSIEDQNRLAEMSRLMNRSEDY